MLEQLAISRGATGTQIAIVAQDPISTVYRQAISQQQLLFFDLGPTLEALQEAGVNPFYWEVTNSEGHWNHAGHAAIGQALAKAIATWMERHKNWMEGDER